MTFPAPSSLETPEAAQARAQFPIPHAPWTFDASPDWIALLDAQGRLLRTNYTGKLVLGSDILHDADGKHWHYLWPMSCRNSVAAAIAGARRGEHVRFQEALTASDGVARWWDVHVAPARHDGEIEYIVCVCRDVTEMRTALADADQARRAAQAHTESRVALVTSVGQEIRKPLNEIVDRVKVLLRALREGIVITAVHHDLATKLQTSCHQLSAVLDDMQDLSKAEGGSLVLNRRDFRLRNVLQRARLTPAELSTVAREISVQIDPAVPDEVSGDPGRLLQVLLVPITCSEKNSAGDEAHIHVKLDRRTLKDVSLRFDIRFSKRELTEKQIADLLGEFEVSSAMTSQLYGRSGLGFTLSRRIVCAMGGTAGITSQPGIGSTFWFTVRLGLPDTSGADLAEFADPPAVLRGRRILVVDDDPLARDVVQQLLELAGVVVVAAKNGKEAVEAVQRSPFDAVLMDMLMPVMGGIDATRMIRALPRCALLPVIAMTGNVLDADREAFRRAGASDFLSKPLDTAKLWNAMAHWTCKPRGTSPTLAPARPGDPFYQPTVPGVLI